MNPTPTQRSDERFMRMAIKEASRALGCTAPNPAVGAVIVKNGRVVAKGHHQAAGLPHAEIEAFRKLPPSFSERATLYVTLEPCSSHGRTPPCTDAIIAAGISRVVYGATDPDKRHRGRAARILKRRGIEVSEGILLEECAALNAHWNHRAKNALPWVIAKAGMSLDGRIDSPSHRRWITSVASRREAMKLRTSVESILVGGGTVRADDPSLTIRGIKLPKGHPQPWRVVWTRCGKIPKKSKLLTDPHCKRTIILARMSLRTALKELGKRGISSVLIEGGGHTLGEAFRRNLVDEVRFFIAPVIQGGNIPVLGDRPIVPTHLTKVTYKRIGSDLMISAKVSKTPSAASKTSRP
jgi:diaminohydroxyphosphoribosylaminopyrimidine deaminase/5-amino-6-(5-phosphoribosylamino)uracil reductase